MTYRTVMQAMALPVLLAACPVAGQEPAERDEPIRTVPALVDADAKAAVAGINAFSLDLYRRTIPAEENHFLSPASVSVALGIAYRGARGMTASELERTMHFGKPPHDYLRANGQLLETMSFAGPQRELRTANAVWAQSGMPLVPDYERDVAQFAKAGLQRVNFRKNPEAARLKVNDWVASSTRDKIRDLLAPGEVTGKTRAILVNAIYWKGAWASAFDKGATKAEPFTLLSGKQQPATLMLQRAHFQVVERDGVKAILLPYVGREVEMVIFLPNSPKALPKFEERLTVGALSRWFEDMEKAQLREVILTMPKMHVEWRKDLKPDLVALGAPTAFSDGADFSGMAVYPNPSEPEATGLKISKVVHKTYLDVDEFGSEAAAATAVLNIVVSAAGPRNPPPPFIFRADRPFLFLLRDRRTGLILFMGRYLKPGIAP